MPSDPIQAAGLPASSAPGTTPAGPDPRTRLVVILSSVAAVSVMLLLVGLALFGRHDDAGANGRGGAGGLGTAAGLGPRSQVPLGTPAMPQGCLPDPDRPPRLEVELGEQGIDFGKLKQGALVERRVTFRSTGKGPLCIRDVQTGCGCVRARVEGETKRFEPGESGALIITFDSKDRYGVQHKAFTVVTNELDHSRRTWPVKGDVSLGVVASVHAFDFGRPRKGAPGTGTVRLSSPKTDAPWKVTEVIVRGMGNEPAPSVTWEAVEVPDPTLRVVDLKVTHPGRTQEGQWRAPVIVRLDHPERPEIVLEGVLNILAPIQPTPPMAVFGFVESGGTPREITIHLRPGTTPAVPFEVKDVRVEPPAGRAFGPGGAPFLVEHARVADAAQPTWALKVRYDGKARKAGLLEGDLVVTTDLKDQPEIRIPLRATVAGK
jgi:hypothetical protein